MPSFEFDPAKAAANLKKQGVSFDEAATVFDDPLSSTLPDDQHSDDEDRFITVGMSALQRLPFVVYTERDSRIRLIGARRVAHI
ncbi:MAG: BrnT family toxin [Acidobacteriaceae bacterium]